MSSWVKNAAPGPGLRTRLAALVGKELVFIATFYDWGIRSGLGWKETILLQNVRDQSGQELCSHMWLRETQRFECLHLRRGDVVAFCGKISPYTKGFAGRGSTDYTVASIKTAELWDLE